MTTCYARCNAAISGFILLMASSGCAINTRSITFTDEQPPLPELAVPSTHEKIVIDGKLNEQAWGHAAIIELQDFWQKPFERTRVRVLHSVTELYVSYECWDSHIVADHNQHDEQTFRDDCVEFFVAESVLYADKCAAIEINAAGAWADLIFRYPAWLNYDWNPDGLRVAVSRASASHRLPDIPDYIVELSIPYADLQRALTIPDYPSRLRANFARWNRPGKHLCIWSYPRTTTPHPHGLNRYGWLILKP